MRLAITVVLASLAAAACGPPPAKPEPAPPPKPGPAPPPAPPPRLSISVEIPKNVALAGDYVYIATGTRQVYLVDRREPELKLVLDEWANSLAGDGDAVYASLASGIVRFDAGSTDPVRVVDIEAPLSMVTDGGYIYFNRFMKPGLFRASKAGGKAQKLSGIKRVTYFGVDDRHVYFGNYGGRSVQRVPKAGGRVETVVSRAGRPIGVAVDANYVYWGNESGSSIHRAAKDGSGRVRLAGGQFNHDQLQLDEEYVYWRAWRKGAADSIVARVPKTSPDQVEIIEGRMDGASGIALDDETLFVALKNEGRVIELNKSAGQ